MNGLVVIGIDPGLAATGYGVITYSRSEIVCVDCGCISTRSDQDVSQRLQLIYDSVCSIMDQWSPKLMVLEEVFIKQVIPSAALSLGQVRGAIMLAANRHGCKVVGLAPRTMKMAVTGSGSADKAQIERALSKILRMPEKTRTSHAADALGLAYAGAMRHGKEV